MRRLLLTALATLTWLLASPSLQLPEGGWLEVGATPAAAQQYQGIMVSEEPAKDVKSKKDGKKKSAKKKPAKPARVGSSGIVTSNQPGKYPMQQITPPQTPNVTTGTVTRAPDVRDFPNVPSVPVLGNETSQDRVARCTHQGALGGLPAGQQGQYIHNCAF